MAQVVVMPQLGNTVESCLITTWLVPVMTKVSYGPIFILVAALVPVSLLSLWFVTGRIAPVQPNTPIALKDN